MKFGFMELIYEVLTDSNIPLSVNEIWNIATYKGLVDKLGSSGKTPVRTLAARLYTDIKENDNTKFEQVNKRPAKFYLVGKTIDDSAVEVAAKKEEQKVETKYNERDLHKLLATFVNMDAHFNCSTKTIYHEKSNKAKKGYNEWLHPDLVGIYFPFHDYSVNTLKLIEVVKENPYKFFAFEIKKVINFSNLREYYFQAVSNSSWAHEGYLVTLEMEEDISLNEELRRLSNAFGIGVIKLNASNISQSEVLFQAREKEALDWETIERLINENVDFKSFVQDLTDDVTNKRARGKYDDVFLDDESAEKFAKEKGII